MTAMALAKKPKTSTPRTATTKRKSSSSTKVAIIGAGRGGTALMEIFAQDPLVQIVGLAEINPKAKGIALARQLKIPIVQNYRELFSMENVELVIDVSGDADVQRYLKNFRGRKVAIIGAANAKFMWQLIEARIRATGEIEKTLNKYQSLYQLYVKEAGAAVTEERTRIACEIHDGLVQSLAGVNFKLDLCEELVPKDPKACSKTLRETKAHLKLAIQEARQVIFNLRPVQFEKMELIPALTNYLQSYETQYHTTTKFSVKGNEHTIFPKTKIFLFRILQEVLSNVQKHAKAKEVSVDLVIGRETLTVTMADNGIGFDMKAIAQDPEKWDHFGLRGIVERAKLVGGEATIQSKKGKGTRVTIKVPLVKKEAVIDGTH